MKAHALSAAKAPIQNSPVNALRSGSRAASPRTASRRRLLFPREHGAWGMVSLPFLVGALVAGHWTNLRTVVAALAVFSLFLLREPLLMLWRQRMALRKYGSNVSASAGHSRGGIAPADPQLSLWTYGLIAGAASLYLLVFLPGIPLLLLGGGAALLLLAVLYFTIRNSQRHPALQLAGVIGLTSSSLLAYLACRGRLEAPAFWIWALSAAHGSASVLAVHARLESLLAAKKSGPAPRTARRNALLAQAILGALFGILAATGRPWLILPFLPPTILHGWELWPGRGGQVRGSSLHRVGWMQLSASLAFSFLLLAVLRWTGTGL